jgi:hypothetical protein
MMSSGLSGQGITLTRSEINRMRQEAAAEQEVSMKTARKAELKMLSQRRMEKWPNTLEALRKKKESWLRDQREKEEMMRQKIDREEAEIRKQQRLDAITRANDLLYAQTDKMKMLKSQKLYSDVIYDRRYQIADKMQQKEAYKKEMAQYHQEILKKIDDGEAVDRKKELDAIEQMKQIAISRKEQVDDARAKRAAEERERVAIGVAMRAKAAEQVEEEIRQEEGKQKYIRDKNEQMILANGRLKVLREEQRERERLAEAARDSEKQMIEDRAKARKQIEINRFEKSQVRRQMLIDAATKQLNAFNTQENNRLLKQQTEFKEKEERDFREKEEKRQREWNQIVASRTEQINARQALQDRHAKEDAKQLGLWAKVNDEEIQKALDVEKEKKDNVKKLKKMQWADAQALRAEKERARLAQIEKERMAETVFGDDDDKFTRICKGEIKKYSEAGKPIYPLLRALEYTQPDLLAANTEKDKRPPPKE